MGELYGGSVRGRGPSWGDSEPPVPGRSQEGTGDTGVEDLKEELLRLKF